MAEGSPPDRRPQGVDNSPRPEVFIRIPYEPSPLGRDSLSPRRLYGRPSELRPESLHCLQMLLAFGLPSLPMTPAV